MKINFKKIILCSVVLILCFLCLSNKYANGQTNYLQTNPAPGTPFYNAPLGQAVPSTPPQPNTNECFTLSITSGLNFNLQACVAQVTDKVLWLSSWFLWIAATVFNFTIKFSLDLGTFLTQMPIVGIGWKILRDLANITFIFILLAIAIGTILQIDSYDVKKLLARVIIVALLLNFSLFFAKVVIDASNILTLQFYNRISSSGSTTGVNGADSGISDAILKGLGITSLYSLQTQSANTVSQPNSSPAVDANIILIGIGGSILLIIAAFVFWVATILFIIRTIVLIFVMILSPLAFIAYVLPQTKGYGSKWVGTLLKQAFFAPIFMLLIYIVVLVITTNYKGSGSVALGGGQMNFASLIAGQSNFAGTIYTFIILIALLLGSVMVAKTFGAYGSSSAVKWGGKLSFGVAGRLSRATVGRTAKSLQESSAVKKFATKSFVGRGLEKGLGGVASTSFDPRAIPGLEKTAGKAEGKGGFAQSFKDRQKALEDQQKRITSETPKESLDKLKATEDREAAESLQSEALFNEREGVIKEIDRIKEEKRPVDEELKTAKAELDQVELMKKAEIDAFTKITEASNIEKQREQAIIDSTTIIDPSGRIKDEARKRLGEIDTEVAQKQTEHENKMQPLETDSQAKGAKVSEIENRVKEMDSALKKQNEILGSPDGKSGIEKKLKDLNNDYKAGGNIEENKRKNYELRSKVAQKAIKYQDYAKKNDLQGKTSSEMNEHVKQVQTNHIIIKGDIAKKKEEREDNFIRPNIASRVASKFGITSAQINLANKVRKDRGKSQAEKFFDEAKKEVKKDLDGDKKEETPTPPPTSPPPSTT